MDAYGYLYNTWAYMKSLGGLFMGMELPDILD